MKSTKLLGATFIRCGLGLFLFGLFIGFGIIGHYLHGAQYPTGEAFLHNMTLWFTCPWTLSVYTIQVGGLGMVVLGILYWILGKDEAAAHVSSTGLWLCVFGLIGIFCTGYAGYFVADAIWPQFYYKPVEAGKNAWLLAQLLCMVSYFVGTILVWRTVSELLRGAIPK